MAATAAGALAFGVTMLPEPDDPEGESVGLGFVEESPADPGPMPTPASIELDPRGAAIERIPLAGPEFDRLDDIPDEVLEAHLACTIELFAPDRPPALAEDLSDETTESYAECAVEVGVDDYVAVYLD
ncbi:MAG: hypothetical protein ACRBI6_11400 [Acidimicrobiales bacterium]